MLKPKVIECDCASYLMKNGVVFSKHPKFMVRVDQIRSLTEGTNCGDIWIVDTGTQTPITGESASRLRDAWLEYCDL